jgi:hypothetical protein
VVLMFGLFGLFGFQQMKASLFLFYSLRVQFGPSPFGTNFVNIITYISL